MPITWLEQRWAGEKGSQWARGDHGTQAAGKRDGERVGGRTRQDVKQIMGFAAESGKEEVQRLVETARREALEDERNVTEKVEEEETVQNERGDVQQFGRMQVVL